MTQIKKSFTSIILVSITPVLVAIGLVLNLLTIMVFSRLKMRKYCMSISMICLAISDTAVLTISVLLSWIDESFYDLYYLNNTIWCNLHGYVDMVACANSSWIIILISIERWFAVCKPWQKSRVFTNYRVGVALLTLFLISVVLFSYFPFSMVVSKNESLNKDFELECKINHAKYYKYLGFISILLIYFFPFVILAILNAMILYRLRVSPFSSKLVTLRNKSFNKSLKVSSIKSKNSSKKKKEAILTNNENPSSNLIGASVAASVGTSVSLANPVSTNNNTQVASASLAQTVIPIQTTNSKNDRSLSITLLTVSITFVVLTFPFQINWIFHNIDIFKSSQYSSNKTELNTTHTTTKVNATLRDSSFSNHLNLTASITNVTTLSNLEYYQISFIIKNMNYVINFFLYSALSTLFRQEFLAIFKESKFFACVKCINYKRVITEAKFSKKSSMSEIVFPVNPSSTNKNGNNKYLKIRIEPTNLAKYLTNKKTSHNKSNEINLNKSYHNNKSNEEEKQNELKSNRTEKKLLVKRPSVKTIKLKQYDKNKINSIQIDSLKSTSVL